MVPTLHQLQRLTSLPSQQNCCLSSLIWNHRQLPHPDTLLSKVPGDSADVEDSILTTYVLTMSSLRGLPGGPGACTGTCCAHPLTLTSLSLVDTAQA